MKYEELKSEVKDIVDICESVPEKYRSQCFDILLQSLLSGVDHGRTGKREGADAFNADGKDEKSYKQNNGNSPLPTPSQIKVLMQKTGVTLDELQQIAMYEDDEVHFILEPTTKKIARGQIEWALMTALRNGVTQNNLAADPENVRSICIEKGFYDKANFAATFKTPKNAALFQGPMEAQGEPQKLSAEGQKELGKLVKQLTTA